MNAASRGTVGVVSLLILTGGLSGTFLPVNAQTFDLSREFSRVSNPAGARSYGYEANGRAASALFGFSRQLVDSFPGPSTREVVSSASRSPASCGPISSQQWGLHPIAPQRSFC